MPAHAIGQGAVDELRSFGVNTTDIVRGGDRIGTYYLEKGVVREAVYVFMIEHILQYRKLYLQILTGIGFLKELSGFISLALHRLLAQIW